MVSALCESSRSYMEPVPSCVPLAMAVGRNTVVRFTYLTPTTIVHVHVHVLNVTPPLPTALGAHDTTPVRMAKRLMVKSNADAIMFGTS